MKTAKKFPDVKVLRIAKADREALDRVADAIAGGNASKALRQLVSQADESLRENGIYAQQAAARKRETDPDSGWFAKMWPNGTLPSPGRSGPMVS